MIGDAVAQSGQPRKCKPCVRCAECWPGVAVAWCYEIVRTTVRAGRLGSVMVRVAVPFCSAVPPGL